MLLSDGATATAILPNLPDGKPLCILFHVAPPSSDLYKALFVPPELNDHPDLLNSHIDAYRMFGSLGSMMTSPQPVVSSI